MKLIIISFALFVCFLEKSQCAPVDEGKACAAEYLKQRGLLDKSFPSARASRHCSFAVELTLPMIESLAFAEYEVKGSINVDCVKRKLKQKNFFDYYLKDQVIKYIDNLPMETITKMIEENYADEKRILDEASSECKSDPTWAGIYDKILGIKNNSLTVQQHNYCALKNSLDKNLLKVEYINRNVDNIDTSKVDCDAIIQRRFDEMKNQMRVAYREQRIGKSTFDCLIKSASDGTHFDTLLAHEINDKIDIPFDVRRSNFIDLESKVLDSALSLAKRC